MKITNKLKVNRYKKSLEFVVHDYRKIVSVVVCLLVPVVNNLWRFLPEDQPIAFYSSMQTFGWTVSIHFMSVLICIAWWFTINNKNYVLQILSLGLMSYCVYLTYSTIPFSDSTPLWQDIAASMLVFFCLWISLSFIKRKYLERDDYKYMHDGLVSELNHQRFLGSVTRIEGLLLLQDLESEMNCKMYNKLMKDEIENLKSSFIYISEKYEKLN